MTAVSAVGISSGSSISGPKVGVAFVSTAAKSTSWLGVSAPGLRTSINRSTL